MSVLRNRVIGLATSLPALGAFLLPAARAQVRPPSHNCDMSAVITHAKAGEDCLIAQIPEGIGQFDDPMDFFYDFTISRSSLQTNPDGYRVVYYRDDEPELPANQVEDLDYRSPQHYGLNSGPLSSARQAIMNAANEAVIVLAHARKGTGGLSGGNHPFTFTGERRTWSFMHNGGIKDENDTPDIKYALWYDLYYDSGGAPGSWFVRHPSNWVPSWSVGNYSEFIDSELLFHWIMKNVLEEEGDVLAGLYRALTAQLYDPVTGGTIDLFYQFMQNYHTTNRLNFVLCDGEALYVFRNTPWDWSSGGTWDHELSYELFDSGGGFVAVKTQEPLANRLPQFTLAYVPRFGLPVELPNFHLGYTQTRTVPTEFATIQAAIDASSNGDVVLVRPGTYVENIDFAGRAITVRSDGDGDPETFDLASEFTVIDGDGLDTTVTFCSGETALSRLVGLTVTNGQDCEGAYQFGGGVWCTDFSCPALVENRIVQNRAKYGGGISCLEYSSPRIEHNVIRDNIAESSGGGVHLGSSRSTLSLNVIETNVGGTSYTNAQGGGLGIHNSRVKLLGNLIAGNFNFLGHAGAISANASHLVMVSNTVSGNRDSGQTCDGIYLYNQSTLKVYNSILYGNSYNLPWEVVLSGAGNYASFGNSIVEGGPAGVHADPGSDVDWDFPTMIDQDPLFVGGGDYHLDLLSPCLDRGSNRAPYLPALDLDGRPRILDAPNPVQPGMVIPLFARTDMGAYEYTGLERSYSYIDPF